MSSVGFLHTSEVHVSTFGALLRELAPTFDDVHLVDRTLLTDAQQHGVNDALRGRLQRRIEELGDRRVDIVVCTCSTLSADAEALSAQIRLPVLRVDRPMAEAAVARGGRIAVVVAVASTLAPSRRLLEESAAAAGTTAVVIEAPCLEAWRLFEAGDRQGYLDRIAQHVRELARDDVDAIVLAQASMAPVAARIPDITVPVFSSPRTAVERAVALIRAQPICSADSTMIPSGPRTQQSR